MSDPISRPNRSEVDAVASYGPPEPLTSSADTQPARPLEEQGPLIERTKSPSVMLEKATVVVARGRTNSEVSQCRSIVSNTGKVIGQAAIAATGLTRGPAFLGGLVAGVLADATAAAICDPPATKAPASGPNAPAAAPNDEAR